MLLHFMGKTGATSIPWVSYAILRDNVQHHAEQTKPSLAFDTIHAIERAVDEGSTTIDAYRLHHELLRAWYLLAKREPREIAIGNRTIAVMFGAAAETVKRHTVPLLALGLALPEAHGGYMCNLFEATFAKLFTTTATAVPGDQLIVTRLAYTRAKGTPVFHPLGEFAAV